MTGRRTVVIEKFQEYALERNIGEAVDGGFSSHKDMDKPTLFGVLDFAYAYYILDLLEESSEVGSRVQWIETILSYQDADGWFRANDKQRHSVEHSTAYALGAIQLLMSTLGQVKQIDLQKDLKPFKALTSQISETVSLASPPVKVSFLDNLHIWRGSHKIAGIPAIIGILGDLLDNPGAVLNMRAPDNWLELWADYYQNRVDKKTGYWILSPKLMQSIFDNIYQYRHDPLLAKMGGAVHLFWVFSKIGIEANHASKLVQVTASLQEDSGLFERIPYCIDFDAVYILSYAIESLEVGDEIIAVAKEVMRKNREAIITWLIENEWPENSHRIPGALAAIAQTDQVLQDAEKGFNNPLSSTWWL